MVSVIHKPTRAAGVVVSARSGCWSTGLGIYVVDITKSPTYSYSEWAFWCGDGVGHATVWQEPTTVGNVDWAAGLLGWRYNGNMSGSPNARNMVWHAKNMTQGYFEYCPPRVFCIQAQYPLVIINGNYDGTFSRDVWPN